MEDKLIENSHFIENGFSSEVKDNSDCKIMIEILTSEKYGFPNRLANEFVNLDLHFIKRVFIIDNEDFKKYNKVENDIESIIISISKLFNQSDVHCKIYDTNKVSSLKNILLDIYRNDITKYYKKKLVIFTNNDHSNNNVEEIIQPLIDINFSITICVYTDDVKVIKYWCDIEKSFGIKLDIISNYEVEKTKIMKYNPDLNYTYHLHKMREFGASDIRFNSLNKHQVLSDDINYFNSITVPNKYNMLENCIIM